VTGDPGLAEFRQRAAVRQAAAYRDFFEPVTAAWLPALAAAAGPGAGRPAVDVGCGTGALAATLRRSGWRCCALDRSAAMLRPPDGTPIGPPGEAVVGDALALPVRSGGVDLVCAAFLVSHVDDLGALLAEFRRVLRPGGRLVVANWCGPADSPYNGLLVSILRRYARSAGLDRSLERSQPEHLAQHLTVAGFTAGAVELVRTTATPASARSWWDRLLAASSGLAAVLRSRPAPERDAVRRDFLAAAGRYARDGALAVDAAAYLVAAST
jgi:SAM-dependent methyltransferase